MIRSLTLLAAGVMLMAAAPHKPAAHKPAASNDPYAYLEEIEGAKALDFARAENARSLPQLQSDPRYAGIHADALKIVTAKDRIPNVHLAGDGTLRDFWQDQDHVRGIWRTTTVASY